MHPLRCNTILLVSSVKLARKLGVKRKSITVFVPSQSNLETKVSEIDTKTMEHTRSIRNYHNDLNQQNQAQKKVKHIYFESDEGLLKLLQQELGIKLQLRLSPPST